MKVSDVCATIQDIERLRDIMQRENHELINSEIQEICDLLWDYRCELLKKEVK